MIDKITDELRGERVILCDPKQGLVRRLEALYALKEAAIAVHPRITKMDNAALPCKEALMRRQQQHLADGEGGGGHNDTRDESSPGMTRTPQRSTPQRTDSTNSLDAAGNPTSPGSPISCNDIVNYTVDAFHDAIDTTTSVLLQHELLYNLGQFGSKKSIPVCLDVVRKYDKYHEVSRHEAIEALGAIGRPDETISALREVMAQLPQEGLTVPIVESAELAFDLLNLIREKGLEHVLREHAHRDFISVDPSPSNGWRDMKELRKTIMDPDASLFDRYKCMFALRNLNNPFAVEILCEALVADKTSCLFRHEVAFVLGQMEYELSIPALTKALANESEHAMVRHEAAESLGAIGSGECKRVLTEFARHPEPLVADSCHAALQLMNDAVEVVEVKYGMKEDK